MNLTMFQKMIRVKFHPKKKKKKSSNYTLLIENEAQIAYIYNLYILKLYMKI